jgi:hypothetical protein
MTKLFKNKKGVAVVYLAISMVVLLLFAALVIDIGMLALNKSKLQNACDAAALAGAQELPETAAAESVAREYAVNNGVENGYIHVEFPAEFSNKKITVTAVDKPVGFFFARIIGINQGLSSARASAVKAPVVEGISGVRPFGLKDADFEKYTEYVIKDDSGDGDNGNFQWLDMPYYEIKQNGDEHELGPTDALENNILNENQESYQVYNPELDNADGAIDSYTGDKTKALEYVQELYNRCTKPDETDPEKHEPDCPRIITVPILGDLSLFSEDSVVATKAKEAGITTYPIVGFAKFMLTVVVESDEKGKGNITVKGIFIGKVTTGGIDLSQPDFKLNGVKLTD